MESKRFPGKPLAKILGKPMIQWVYERTLDCKLLDEVIIATDSQEIIDNMEFALRLTETGIKNPRVVITGRCEQEQTEYMKQPKY